MVNINRTLRYFFTTTLLLLLGAPLSVLYAEEEGPIGKVIAIIGTVEHRVGVEEARKVAEDPWAKAEFQQAVYAKDEFRTLQRSRVKILFADNSLIALGPNSSMKVASYIYKPDEKLRQGVINVASGLSMYIVNKSQKNKNSSFRMVSPTANIAARGTHGYFSSMPDRTLVANQAGAVETTNSDPAVMGQSIVGPMSKTVIEKGRPPLPPTPLGKNDLNTIRNIIIGAAARAEANRQNGRKPLVEVHNDEEKTEDSSGDSNAQQNSNSTTTDPLSDFDTAFSQALVQDVGLGTTADFLPVNNPFDATATAGNSCAP